MSIGIALGAMRPATVLIKRRCRLLLPWSACALIMLAGTVASATVPTNGIGNPMQHLPELQHLQTRTIYNPALIRLWYSALQQNIPEVISKTCSAISVAAVHRVPNLSMLIPPLEHLAVSKTVSLPVRISVVKALATIRDRHSESFLARLDAATRSPFALELDPVLARWKSAYMPMIWLRRLELGAAAIPVQVAAAHALGRVDAKSADTVLKQIVSNTARPFSLRLAAAKSLAILRPSGLAALGVYILKTQGRGRTQRLLVSTVVSAADSVLQRQMARTFATDSNSAVAAIAWRALLRHDVAVLRPLAFKMSKNADPTIRLLVARTWRHLGGKKSIQGLAELLNDPRRPIRWYARAALSALGAAPSSRRVVIHACRSVIHGQQPRAIRQACLVLSRLDDKASAKDFVSLLSSGNQAVRLGAVVAIRRVAVRTTLPQLLVFVKKTATNSRYAFGHIAKPGYLPQFDADSLELSQSFQFFGLMRYRPALPVMVPCIPKHAPYGIAAREAAIWAIGMIDDGQSHPRLAKELAGRLDDMALPFPEFEPVRKMAAISLGRLQARAQLTDLKASFSTRDIGHISLACRWAIEKLTGKVLPLPHSSRTFQTGFLMPLGH
ncbi:MAG: HEAT repeat domain-containing protein [Phycisphaerae bacterium]